jgi:hypothetical protein
MTEAEWLAATEPKPMLAILRGKVSDRKLRLLAVACCRRIWHLLDDVRSQNAVLEAERHAVGLLTDEQLTVFSNKAKEAFIQISNAGPIVSQTSKNTLAGMAVWSATLCRSDKSFFFPEDPIFGMADFTTSKAAAASDKYYLEVMFQATLVRDIFGNPYRPVTFNQAWLTSTVLALATGIYNERAFDRMPILAHALQDAGCDNEEVLNHCRQPGEHVRGCFVVDLLLGKT